MHRSMSLCVGLVLTACGPQTRLEREEPASARVEVSPTLEAPEHSTPTRDSPPAEASRPAAREDDTRLTCTWCLERPLEQGSDADFGGIDRIEISFRDSSIRIQYGDLQNVWGFLPLRETMEYETTELLLERELALAPDRALWELTIVNAGDDRISRQFRLRSDDELTVTRGSIHSEPEDWILLYSRCG